MKEKRIYLGKCKGCRGPMKWYLEDEIAFTRLLIADQRLRFNHFQTERQILIAKKRGRIKNGRRKGKSKGKPKKENEESQPGE